MIKAKIIIETSSEGLKHIRLSPWSDETFSPLRPCKIEICFQGNSLLYKKLQKDLKTYFSGQPVIFSYPVDWQDIPPFTRKILELTQLIPWGGIETYGGINAQLSKKSSPRAVGTALGRNPMPIIIPCHRVQKKSGALGGFSSGIWWKKFFLSLENGPAPETHVEFCKNL